MGQPTMAMTTVAEVVAELAAPNGTAVNGKYRDDHGVDLGKLRAIAKPLKTQQEPARELWATGDR